MRKDFLIGTMALAAVLLLAAPSADAQNSLAVTSSAAMGNTTPGATCEGDGMPGPCGLEMRFAVGQVNQAYVQSTHPTDEVEYRARWWMDLNNFNMLPSRRNFFFITHGTYSGTGNLSPVIRMPIGYINGMHVIGAEVWDNQLNRKGVPWCVVPSDGPFELQMEFTAGNVPNQGVAIMTVYESGVETCRNEAPGGVQNAAFDIDYQTFTTLPEGGITADSTIYIDEFESFRTLAPTP